VREVLLERAGLPQHSEVAERPLLALKTALAARGVTLPAPAGSRPCGDGRDFLFIVERSPAPPGMAWHPLREVTDDGVWSLYSALVLGGYTPPTRAIDVWSFGDRPEMASQLAHLVMCGEKRVTMGWVDAAEKDGTPLPLVGGVSVVTDAFGYPRCVLRSAEVKLVPFGEVDAASAAGEGEGDLTRADWHEGHTAYFQGEAARNGLVFDDTAVIAIERFEVLHIVGRT
jgi:uncharacterized protein YhfF